MSIPEYDDNRIVRDARTIPDPWVKRGLSEDEYNQMLDDKRLAKFEARKKELLGLIPRLEKINQKGLASWIAWQANLDWNSYDLANAIRAAHLFLAGDKRSARHILDGIIGLLVEDTRSTSHSVHPTPFAPEGNVKYTGDMALEITPEANKELLRNIGSGFRKRK